MRGRIALGVALWLSAGSAAPGDLAARVRTTTVTLPQPLEPAMASYCTWGACTLGPRLYPAPRADGSLLVGWTDSSGTGHVSVVTGGVIGGTHDFPGTRVKGLVAHEDGGYAVLLWNSASNVTWLSRRSANGSETWATDLNSTVAVLGLTCGDSRLAWTGTTYAAYYAVYGTSGPYAGHNGDQLKLVGAAGAVLTGGWDWGCSHSMAELVGYHTLLGGPTALCSSDMYPQKGLVADRSRLLVASDGNGAGLVSLQLGQMAAGATTWKVAFNAMNRPCCTAFGIGFASVDAAFGTTVAWLTSGDGAYERDPVLARLPARSPAERYVVGWRTTNDADFHLAVVDGGGAFLEGPQSVGAAGIAWGDRDDSFRGNRDGSITWVQGDASSSTLRVYRFVDDLLFTDGFE
jgi:hypothetical protein